MSGYTTPATAGDLTQAHPVTRTRIRDLGCYIALDPPDSLGARASWLLANIEHPAVAAGIVETQAELDSLEADAARIRSLPGYRWAEEDAITTLIRAISSPYAGRLDPAALDGNP